MKYLSASNAMSAASSKRSKFDVGEFSFSTAELLIMRLGFALLVFAAIKWEVGSLSPADPKKLTGLAHFIKLDWLVNLKPIWLWQSFTIFGLITYVAGIAPALGLLPALFFSIGIGTLANSQGASNHSTQLVSMMLLGQFFTYLFYRPTRLNQDRATWWLPALTAHRRATYVAMVIFAAGYVVCGYVKLRNSDGEWFQRIPGLAVEMQKTNLSSYYDNLTPVPESLNVVVDLMTHHVAFARIFFGAGLLLELFAFLALMGRRWAFFYGLAIIFLHLSVSRLMQLDFWYHMAASLIFFVNLPGFRKTFTRTDRLSL